MICWPIRSSGLVGPAQELLWWEEFSPPLAAQEIIMIIDSSHR